MEYLGNCEEAGCVYKGSTGIFVRDAGLTDDVLDIITPKDDKEKAKRNLEILANKFYNSNNDQQPEPFIVITYAGPEKLDRTTIVDLAYDKIVPHEMIIVNGEFYPKNPPCEDAHPTTQEQATCNDQRKELLVQGVQRMQSTPAYNKRKGGEEHIFDVSRGLYMITDKMGCCNFTYNYRVKPEELVEMLK